MKKIIFGITGFLLLTCCFTSCELLSGNCQTCQLVHYENGVVIDEEDPAEYCDEDLIAIKAIAPVTVGGVTTQWECW